MAAQQREAESRVADLQGLIAEVKRSHAATTANLAAEAETKERAAAARLEEASLQAERRTAERDARAAAELARVREDHMREANEMRRGHETELTGLTSRLTAAASAHTTAMSELRSRSEVTLVGVKSALEAALADADARSRAAARESEAASARARRDWEESLRTERSEAAAVLADLQVRGCS